MIRVVIDTNVWISSLSKFSESHWLIESFLNEEFTLAVTTEILLEYKEKLKEKYSHRTAEDFLEAMTVALNVEMITLHFQWHLIPDSDDNKFADCAIAAGADFLVTEDHDFDVLKQSDFPRMRVLTLRDFKSEIFPRTE